MNYCTPEQVGISSRNVLRFYQELESWHLSTHGVILSRGQSIFSECYYAPFHKDFLHRAYSSTKSFVSVAIGFCQQDGFLSLDDPLSKSFPEYPGSSVHTSTIRQMLQMRTTLEHPHSWFTSGTKDRVAWYFENAVQKTPGTLFTYDSTGSFILCAVVEKVTGKPFLEYLREKFLDDIGFSRDACCLRCPGGHSWGDSGLLCTTQDLWRFARFVLNGGTWEGKRYLEEGYLTEATNPEVPTDPYGFEDLNHNHGYGYQFWGNACGCFTTLGMGGQLTLCDPAHDFVFAINSDNQGNPHGVMQIFSALHRHILANLGDPLPEDPEAKAELDAYLSGQKLFCLPKSPVSSMAEKIRGRTFVCQENPMGIRWFRLAFAGDEGSLTYENQQGEKVLSFGLGRNVFAKFPQEGYSDTVGTVPVPGHRYDAAISADWPSENTLRLRVQIVDKYFGNLSILIGFSDEYTAAVRMEKTAEHFLDEYKGVAMASAR